MAQEQPTGRQETPPAPRRLRMGSRESNSLRQAAVALFEEGLGYKACAGTLGISVYTARDWLLEYKSGRLMSDQQAQLSGQGKRRAPAEGDRQRARELREQGRSYSEISKELGLSRSTVRSWLQDPELPVSQSPCEQPVAQQLDLFDDLL